MRNVVFERIRKTCVRMKAGAAVLSNTLAKCGRDGVVVVRSIPLIAHNRVTDAGNVGLRLVNSVNYGLVANYVEGSGRAGFLIQSAQANIRANYAVNNGTFGFDLRAPLVHPLTDTNTAVGNGIAGFRTFSGIE